MRLAKLLRSSSERARRILPEGLFSDRARALVLLGVVLIVSGALVALLVNGAGEIAEAVVDGEGIALWDRPVLDWMLARRNDSLTAAVAWYSNTGGPIWQPIIMVVIAGVLWWRWRDPTPFVLVMVTQLGAVLISTTAKRVIGRARPPEVDAVQPYETSASFPSGHTLQAFAAATIVVYLLVRHLWDRSAAIRALIVIAGFLYATAMGLSRVYLGYHWLTDVLAAAVLGVAWATVVIACHRVWRTYRGRSRSERA